MFQVIPASCGSPPVPDDSFMGGFLYKICESGKRIEEYSLQEMIECVRFGNAVASLCVEREGAIPAMPVMEEVIKRINS